VSLKHIILGFLKAEGDLSGYDLKGLIDESTAHFWYADFSQIYRSLTALEEKHWVVATDDEESAHNRKTYHLTVEGDAEFLRWLADDLSPIRARRPDLVKLFFGEYVPIEVHRQKFLKRKAANQQLLGTYRAVKHMLETEDMITYPQSAPFWLITVHQGIFVTEAIIRWCDDALQILADLEAKQQSNSDRSNEEETE